MTYCRSQTGDDISSILRNAFDGNTATKPDSATVAHGPVGLVFDCRAWVTRFGYICRNDNYCWERIKNAALFFSASADDATLAQKVRCSQFHEHSARDEADGLDPRLPLTPPNSSGRDSQTLILRDR